MKATSIKIAACALACCASLTSCSFMNNSQKGYVAGSVGGTVLGASLGAAIGGRQGADIGAHLGMAVGGVTGAAAGAAADAEQAQAAKSTPAKTTQTVTTTTTYYDSDTGKTYKKMSSDDSMLFDSRSSELSDYTRDEIEQIADKLLSSSYSEVVIYGSTDNVESVDYSYELSCERANAVADYFVELGVPSDKISVVGLGADSPLADNDTMSGRASNRCVEVYIVEK